ncbi:MAG: hypothetical protein JXA97_10530, partial [Anaerolineales bacterium]|nr:hypothetical protein [Anaerolineales bacterium]
MGVNAGVSSIGQRRQEEIAGFRRDGMVMMRILLLDMDGVLLHSHGYKESLQDNVRLWGKLLGYEEVVLPHEDVLRFESAGVSAEWISGTMCVALMMLTLWEQDPAIAVPASLDAPIAPHGLPVPDLSAFVAELLAASDYHDPLETGVRILTDRCSSPGHAEQVRALVEASVDFERSLFHRVQQELVLGSDQLKSVYGIEPLLDTPGYLSTRDRPAVCEGTVERLLAWREEEGHAAALMTNRPSHSPDGSGSPEAELGLRLLGLEALPFIGMGAIGELAGLMGCPIEDCLKPHAAHALAAIHRAVGHNLAGELEAVRALLQERRVDPAWR